LEVQEKINALKKENNQMKIIVPMAGMGKRLRPHTLVTPKPLVKIAGKTIVQRLVEDITKVCGKKVEEIGFIIGDFGIEVENNLLAIATNLGAKGKIYYQKEPLGTAHAILCAAESLSGNVIVAFADTLFKADFALDNTKDGVLWVSKIEDPSAFGVVKVNANNIITDFIEKPKEFVGDLAMIGIYYFKQGEILKQELQYLIDNKVIKGGEYQLPDALKNMTQKGMEFLPGKVIEWLDCGNKDATVYTNQRILEHIKSEIKKKDNPQIVNSLIIEPCFLDNNVSITNSVIGPHVSIGKNTQINSSVITNSIVLDNTEIRNNILQNAMIGNHVKITGPKSSASIGDYTEIIN
jgi:glucose-1-phosphate thymidylyltransferase